MSMKYIKLLLGFCSIAIAYAGCFSLPVCAGPSQPDADYGRLISNTEEMAVWTCSSGHKVGREWALPEKAGDRVELALAGNEREAVQVVLSPDVTLSNVTISAGNLRAGDNILQADDIEILQVSYLNLTESSDDAYPTGYWPDPLLPVREPLTLKKGINHPFWVRVYAPVTLPAGDYKGVINITTGDGIEQKVPFSVKIYDFKLPDTMTCRSLFGSRFKEVPVYHQLKTREQKAIVYDKYLKSFSEHHISPYSPAPLDSYKVEFSVPKDINTKLFFNGTYACNESHGGSGSLLLEDYDSTTNIYAESMFIPVENLKSLKYSFWYRTILPDKMGTAKILFYDKNKKELKKNIPFFCGNGKWLSYEKTIDKIPDNTAYLKVQLYATGWSVSGTGKGTTWYDDLKLIDMDSGKSLINEHRGSFETEKSSFTPEEYKTLQDNIKVNLQSDAWIPILKEALDKYHFNSFYLWIKGMGGLTWRAVDIPFFTTKEGVSYTEYSTEYEIMYAKFITQLSDALKKGNLLDKVCVYMYDEPGETHVSFLKRNYGRLKKYAPELTTILPTSEVRDELKDEIDVWVMILDKVKGLKFDLSETYWSYVCTDPDAPYPGTFIDHPGVDLRIWLWQSFARDLKGILAWETMYWRNDDKPLSSPYEYPMSASSACGWNWGNGDGRFIYPPQKCFDNKDAEPILDGPVDSVRWEMLRDGIEDYEYLTILRNLLQDLPADSGLKQRYQQLLDLPEKITSLTEFTKDPADIEDLRDKIAKAIVAIKTNN